jgi:hypothetical protein
MASQWHMPPYADPTRRRMANNNLPITSTSHAKNHDCTTDFQQKSRADHAPNPRETHLKTKDNP